MKKRNKRKNKKTTLMLFSALFVSFMMYSYAIASTTFSISDMEKKNVEIQDLQTEIAELEVEYFDLINSLDIARAEKMGLSELKSVSYAELNADTRLAYNS